MASRGNCGSSREQSDCGGIRVHFQIEIESFIFWNETPLLQKHSRERKLQPSGLLIPVGRLVGLPMNSGATTKSRLRRRQDALSKLFGSYRELNPSTLCNLLCKMLLECFFATKTLTRERGETTIL